MTAVPRVGWSPRSRAQRHHIDRRVPVANMHEVVSDLCGVHAQLMSSAELTLLARVEDMQPDSLRATRAGKNARS